MYVEVEVEGATLGKLVENVVEETRVWMFSNIQRELKRPNPIENKRKYTKKVVIIDSV